MRMYRGWAEVYDTLYEAQGQSKDIPLLLALVRKGGGPVLEAACGTGRVMVPLAKAGYSVHGIDTSREMLAVLEKKLRSLPPPVRKRISYEMQDMRHFRVARKFKTCLIAFNSLYHLKSEAAIASFFRCVARYMEEGGMFIVDIFEFDPYYAQGKFMLQVDARDRKGTRVRKYHKTVFGRNQVNDCTFKIVIGEGRGEKVITRKFKLRYLSYEQAWRLLESAGFRVEQVYGNYASASYVHGQQNEKMIFVARKV